MSASDNNNITATTCANCGKGEEAAGDLKACTACKMVKYCNRDCQIAHRPQHKMACKKRAAELHDEKLFKTPPPNEDCPVCMIRLPPLHTGYKYRSCCGKFICSGCIHAVEMRDGGEGLCPFCRTPAPTSEEIVEQYKKRMEVDDAEAIRTFGIFYAEGMFEFPQNYTKALELWHQAAKLGNTTSYYNIGCAYDNGLGVEQNDKKANHYYELAAMGGDVNARHNLGVNECDTGNIDRALKHWMIAAGGGYTDSLENIKQMFMDGLATKDDYAKGLLAYQANIHEIKSPQRDEAAAADEDYKYY